MSPRTKEVYSCLSVFLRFHLLLALFIALPASAQPSAPLLQKVFEEHVARCQRTYGPADPRTSEAFRDLAFFLKDAGETKPAAEAFAQALKIDRSKFGPDSPQPLAVMIALASVSPPADAERLLREALRSPSMNSQLAVPALSTLGDLRLAAGDSPGAASCFRLALQHAELVFGMDADEVSKILYSLSQAVNPDQSVTLLERALTIARRHFGEQHPETATCEINLAHSLLKVNHGPAAAELARLGIKGFEASLGPRHPRVAIALATLAEASSAQGDRPAAQALYQRALEIDRQSLGETNPRTLRDRQAISALQQRAPAK